MKKILIGLLVVLMMAMSVTATAFAVEDMYDTTRAFVDALDAQDIKYTFQGNWRGTEKQSVEISYRITDEVTLDILAFIEEDDFDHVFFRVWDVIKFEHAYKRKVLRIVNELNADYAYVRFYVEDDDTVTMKADSITRGKDFGPMSVTLMKRMVSILTDSYSELEPYSK